MSRLPLDKPLYVRIDFGQLPVDAINSILGTELDPGRVYLSSQAHRHVAEDHPDDYAACLAALPITISSPSFIGQAPRHVGNFEMVRRINRPDGRVVLAAIGLEPDARGDYRIRSCYLVSATTIDARRRAGILKPAPPI